MGAGKSSIGRKLAKLIGTTFTDTDAVIVREHGAIADLFATHGEAHFRAIEERTVAEAVAAGGIVALGGGAVMSAATRAVLRDHDVVLLTVRPEVVARRISGAARPLLNAGDAMTEWTRIMQARRPLYDEVADATFDTSTGHISAVVESIADWAKERQS